MILFLLHLPNLTQQHDEMKKVFLEILVKLFSKRLALKLFCLVRGGGKKKKFVIKSALKSRNVGMWRWNKTLILPHFFLRCTSSVKTFVKVWRCDPGHIPSPYHHFSEHWRSHGNVGQGIFVLLCKPGRNFADNSAVWKTALFSCWHWDCHVGSCIHSCDLSLNSSCSWCLCFTTMVWSSWRLWINKIMSAAFWGRLLFQSDRNSQLQLS